MLYASVEVGLLVIAWDMDMGDWVFSLKVLLVVWYMLHEENLQRYIVGTLVVYCWHTLLGILLSHILYPLVHVWGFFVKVCCWSYSYKLWLHNSEGLMHGWCECSVYMVYGCLYMYGKWLERHRCTWFELYTCNSGYDIYVIGYDWLRRLLWENFFTGCYLLLVQVLQW